MGDNYNKFWRTFFPLLKDHMHKHRVRYRQDELDDIEKYSKLLVDKLREGRAYVDSACVRKACDALGIKHNTSAIIKYLNS